ncbi:MAG: sigma 54-interacting transcriptional regulator [bacterium]
MVKGWQHKNGVRDSMVCTSIAVVVFLLFFGLSSTSLFVGFENKTYDAFLRLRGGHEPHPDIVLVFIGDDTIEKVGTWPISRDFYATFLHILSEYGARAIGFDLLFSERSTEHPEYDEQLVALTRTAANVTYPYFFYLKKDQFLPEEFWVPSDVARIGAPISEGRTEYIRALGGIFPFEDLILAAEGTGHGNILADRDGVVRRSPLVIEYEGDLYPALALSMASDLLGVQREDVRIEGRWLVLNGAERRTFKIPVTPRGEMLINYAGRPGKYVNYSFIQILQSYRQVLEGENPLLPLSELKEKIVLVGMTATGTADVRATPFAEHHPLVGIQANILDNILRGDFIRKAGVGSTLLGMVLSILLIGVLLPLMGTARGALLSLLLFVLTGLLSYLLLARANTWFNANLFWGGILFSTLFINVFLFWSQERQILAHERRARQLNEDLLSRQRHLDRIRQEIAKREKDLQAIGDEEISTRVAKMMEERTILLKERDELERETNELSEKLSQVTLRLKRVERYRFEEIERVSRREELEGDYSNIVGDSLQIFEILKVVDRVAPSNASVLITGESGTGKELVARAIHNNSPRSGKPLVVINAAAIPKELVESELFGHEKGAFTGAAARRVGKFELADGGTVFLDEIGDMPPATQAKILRVIEEKEFMRVGGTETISVDVRMVAATNKDLQTEIEAGHFREDLFHRLNLIPIHLPPLRDRREDIPLLVKFFLDQKEGEEPLRISDEAMGLLMSYPWPGNIRELEQIVERAFILRQGNLIRSEDLSPHIREFVRGREVVREEVSLSGAVEQFEKRFIIEALRKHNWNKSRTAETLKIGRRNLHKKIKKHGIARTDEL